MAQPLRVPDTCNLTALARQKVNRSIAALGHVRPRASVKVLRFKAVAWTRTGR